MGSSLLTGSLAGRTISNMISSGFSEGMKVYRRERRREVGRVRRRARGGSPGANAGGFTPEAQLETFHTVFIGSYVREDLTFFFFFFWYSIIWRRKKYNEKWCFDNQTKILHSREVVYIFVFFDILSLVDRYRSLYVG